MLQVSYALACEDGPAPLQPNDGSPRALGQLLFVHVTVSEEPVQAQHFYCVVASPEGDHVDGSGTFGLSSREWPRGLVHARGWLGSEVQKLGGPSVGASCPLCIGFPYGLSYRNESTAPGGFHKRYLAKTSQFSHVLAAGLSYSFGHTPEHIDLE